MVKKGIQGFLKFVNDLAENLTNEDMTYVLANQQEALELMVDALHNPRSIFKFVGKVCVPATTEKFVVKDNFAVNGNGDVPVSVVEDFFEECFAEIIEEPTAASTLFCRELLKPQNDSENIAALGGKEKAAITLQEFYMALKVADKGKWYLTYIRDKHGSLRCVRAYWGGRGCHVSAYSVDDPIRWYAGNIVVSRNS
ncbi:MAG: hypothetical protein Q8N55_04550 [bacterium]|nr:hypothetical protein [bacterium]